MKVFTGAFQALRLGPKVTLTRRLVSPSRRRLVVPGVQSQPVSGGSDSTAKSSRSPQAASPLPASAAASTWRTTEPRKTCCISTNCVAAATAAFHRVANLVGLKSFRLPQCPFRQQPTAGVGAAGVSSSVSASGKGGEGKAVNISSPPPSGYRSAQMHFPFGLGIYGAAGFHVVDEPKISFPSSASTEASRSKRPGSPSGGGVARG